MPLGSGITLAPGGGMHADRQIDYRFEEFVHIWSASSAMRDK